MLILSSTFLSTSLMCIAVRVAPDMIFFKSGQGRLWNCKSGRAECFLSCGPTWHKQLWNTRVNTKHRVDHQKFAIKLTSKVSDHRTLLLSRVMKW